MGKTDALGGGRMLGSWPYSVVIVLVSVLSVFSKRVDLLERLILVLGALLLGVALLAAIGSVRLGQRANLPAGNVVYNDTRFLQSAPPLVCHRLQLTGKPDYLLAQAGFIIPFELKSTATVPKQPYHGHVLQIAFYCLLVTETYGQRPPYGILRYGQHDFQIAYTPELEQTLLHTLAKIRAKRQPHPPTRSHQSGRKCQHCGMRQYCDQQLKSV